MTLLLTRLFPGDNSVEDIWKDATEVYNISYKVRNDLRCSVDAKRNEWQIVQNKQLN